MVEVTSCFCISDCKELGTTPDWLPGMLQMHMAQVDIFLLLLHKPTDSLVSRTFVVPWLSYVQLLQHHGLQHSRLPSLSPSPGACSNSCPLSWWCHPIISSSVIPFSSCLQFFPAWGSHIHKHTHTQPSNPEKQWMNFFGISLESALTCIFLKTAKDRPPIK